MWMAGLVGLFVGIFLILLLPRFLPFSADTHVAATVIGQDRWNAGVTMMRVADPLSWRGVADSSQLVRDNAEAIGQCARPRAHGRRGSAMHDYSESADSAGAVVFTPACLRRSDKYHYEIAEFFFPWASEAARRTHAPAEIHTSARLNTKGCQSRNEGRGNLSQCPVPHGRTGCPSPRR